MNPLPVQIMSMSMSKYFDCKSNCICVIGFVACCKSTTTIDKLLKV